MATPAFADIGMNHFIQINRVIAVIPVTTHTAKRYLEMAKSRSMYIDASRGRCFRSQLILDDGTVVTSMLNVRTLLKRFQLDQDSFKMDFEEDDDENDLIEFNTEEQQE